MPPSEAEPPRLSRLKRNGNGTGEEDTRGRRKPASKKATPQSHVHGVGEAEARTVIQKRRSTRKKQPTAEQD